MLAALLAAVQTLPLTGTTPPTFADDFYVGQLSSIAINQGGYRKPDTGAVCCDLKHSPQCKVQQLTMGEDVRQQASKDRIRSDSARGSIVTWWGDVKKQMAVVPGSAANSSHKWACAQYCPQAGSFEPVLQIGDGRKGFFDTPKDMGKVTVSQPKSTGGATKECEKWEWTETIARVVPMERTSFYVDMSTTPPSPFFATSEIIPFTKKLGEENASYLQYQPMDVSDYFDIDPDSVAKCQESTQCGDDAHLRALHPTVGAHLRFGPSMYDTAKQAAARAPSRANQEPEKPPYPTPNISFGTDFVSRETGALMINQGGALSNNGDPCCATDGSVPQCQIQTQAFDGMRYFDLSHKRERFEDLLEKTTRVDDYTALKSMEVAVNSTDGKEWCVEYCPIDSQDPGMETFFPFTHEERTLDLGSTTIEGRAAEHYRWTNHILKIVPMQTTDFFADITEPKKAVPLAMQAELTPFGQPLGTENRTWTGWKSATPDKSKFDIRGMATCKKSGNCGEPGWQAHRMRTRQLHTFYSYVPHF